MTDTIRHRRRRRTPAKMLGLTALVLVGALAPITVGVTSAGYTDDASAQFAVNGSYDIALKGTNLAGNVQEHQGNPADFSIKLTRGEKFNRTDAVSWDLAVLSKQTGGEVSLILADTADAPFTVGSTTFPDLFSTLRFKIEDRVTGAVLLDWAPAKDTATRPVSLGVLGKGKTKNLRVSALVAPETFSVYHLRTTGVRLIFQGTT